MTRPPRPPPPAVAISPSRGERRSAQHEAWAPQAVQRAQLVSEDVVDEESQDEAHQPWQPLQASAQDVEHNLAFVFYYFHAYLYARLSVFSRAREESSDKIA